MQLSLREVLPASNAASPNTNGVSARRRHLEEVHPDPRLARGRERHDRRPVAEER